MSATKVLGQTFLMKALGIKLVSPLYNFNVCFLKVEWLQPSEEFQFIASTLQAHMKTHVKLILKPLIYHTANFLDDLTL